MRTRPVLLAATAAIAAVLLAGCSSQPAADDELGYEDSPLSKLLGWGDGADFDEEAAQAESMASQKEIEELVAECMQKEGFEYTPQKVDESMYSSSSSGEWNPDDRDWVAQYGYGMFNWPGRDEPAEASEDPNGPYVESLSESERTAYYEALYGAPPEEEATSEATTMQYDWTTAGCYGAAQHEVYPEDGTALAEFDDLTNAMNEMYSSFYDGTTVTEPDREWAACMTEKGYSEFERQSDAQSSISDKSNAMWEEASAAMGDDPEAEYEDPTKTEAGKKLAEEEISLALVDLDCREKTDYTAEMMRLQFAAEEAFIAEHKEELLAYKAAMDAAEDK